jgi:hypothetical protein
MFVGIETSWKGDNFAINSKLHYQFYVEILNILYSLTETYAFDMHDYCTTILLLYVLTTIRPVVSYGAEAWTMTNKEEQALLRNFRKENI